ncbi:hypothetical protein K440DRAFT_680296 [Wilcoxina mikolae CBS 423.85]|nr:hypothetical protein K440DRAFT_680296 [Wilcoxina mikolae CBS 423.85]
MTSQPISPSEWSNCKNHKRKRSQTSDYYSMVTNNDKHSHDHSAPGLVYVRNSPVDSPDGSGVWVVPKQVLSSCETVQDFVKAAHNLDTAPASVYVRMPSPWNPQRIVECTLHPRFWPASLDCVCVTINPDDRLRFEFSMRLTRNISEEGGRTIPKSYIRILEGNIIEWHSGIEQELREYIVQHGFKDAFKLQCCIWDGHRQQRQVTDGDLISAGTTVICYID